MSLAVLLLGLVLDTFVYTAHDLTSIKHDVELQELDQIIKRISVALKSIDPELIADDFRLGWKD